MIEMREIYAGAFRFISELMRQEIRDQGHSLTGKLEDSLDYQVSKEGNADVMEGTAIYYAQFVNDGFPGSSANWKQLPFVIEFFKKRGLDEIEAKRAAAATIVTWMKKGGMPTQASKRFSKTGSRKDMILAAFTGAQAEIDQFMGDSLDFGVEEKFQETKSETV